MDWGEAWPGELTFSPDDCWAIRQGKPHDSLESSTELNCAHNSKLQGQHVMCIPLIAQSNSIGVMHLLVADTEALPSGFKQLALSIAEHLSLALANLQLQDKLRQQAIRDPLTNLYNRRFMEETLENTISRAARNDSSVALLMMDMDHFKRFNDTFGHDAGDYVLKTVAKRIINNIRNQDIACRFGGEEMAILLPETDQEGAEQIADKICRTIRQLHLEFNNMPLGQLTASIGVATFPLHSANSTELLKSADTALYQAKKNGRDQVQMAEQSTFSELINPTNK